MWLKSASSNSSSVKIEYSGLKYRIIPICLSDKNVYSFLTEFLSFLKCTKASNRESSDINGVPYFEIELMSNVVD